MKKACKNHPDKKALSFCYSCKEYYCADCLVEGNEFYYCKKQSCREAQLVDSNMLDEVEKTKGTDHQKILIDGEAISFCEKCIAETNPTPIQDGLFSKGGATLKNECDRCKICGSVVMDLEKPKIPGLFFRGIFGSYRIIKQIDLDPDALYLHSDKYISRELKN